MLTLSVKKRAEGGVNALRKSGGVPAVVYGAHQQSTAIALNAQEFDKILDEAGEATLVSLSGLGEAIPVLIHEVDLDPLTSRPRHVDFYAVTKGQKVEVNIPLTFVNESAAVKAGANLVKVIHELPVKADPMNLPHDIEVDLALIANIGDKIHVRDLAIPAGVDLELDGDEVVALAQEVVEEKVEEAPPADLSAIEVEKKGKDEEAEAAEGAAPAAKAE